MHGHYRHAGRRCGGGHVGRQLPAAGVGGVGEGAASPAQGLQRRNQALRADALRGAGAREERVLLLVRQCRRVRRVSDHRHLPPRATGPCHRLLPPPIRIRPRAEITVYGVAGMACEPSWNEGDWEG
jgi:hypothetical protein